MHLPLPTHLFASAACSGACLTFMAWMSSWVFILYISFLLWVGHCLGMGFLFFNSAHVFFHPLSVDWLVLLPRHNIVSAMILPNFVYWTSSGPVGWNACHASFMCYSFLYFTLPSIPTGSVHITSWAFPAHFIPSGILDLFHSLGHPRPILFFPSSFFYIPMGFC